MERVLIEVHTKESNSVTKDIFESYSFEIKYDTLIATSFISTSVKLYQKHFNKSVSSAIFKHIKDTLVLFPKPQPEDSWVNLSIICREG